MTLAPNVMYLHMIVLGSINYHQIAGLFLYHILL